MLPHKRQITVLLTGGHAATTAFATIEELRADAAVDWNISWIGPKRALEGSTIKPFELDLFPKLHVTVYSITAGKLQSKFTRYTIPALLKIPVGFISSIILLRKIKPQVVLSFGGFAGVPVVFAAYILGIPIVLHEQTVAAGLANRVTGFFASKIALARVESKQFFNRKKCVVIGNPLMSEVLRVKTKDSLPQIPTIYVTGGSRGAQRINNPVFVSLPKLLSKYKIIHQTGLLDYEKALTVKSKLEKRLQSRYEIHAFINPVEIGNIYNKSSLVVGRAGANTVSEVLSLGIPSIFIPIPWTRANEQTKNAEHAQKTGVSVLLPESRLNPEIFVQMVNSVFKKWNKMYELGRIRLNENMDKNAAKRLVAVLLELIP